MAQPTPIFIWAHLDERARALVASRLPDGRAHFASKHAPTPADRARFAESEIVFGNVPADWLHGAPRLRWLQLESVGFEYYQGNGGPPPGVAITNLKGMFARPAAETAFAGLLSLYRGVDALVPAQTRREWICLDVRPRLRLLHGQRALVLGLGSIGRRMRDLLRAFECEVTVFARTAAEAQLRTLAELDAALPRQDIVVCCLPKTVATIGLLDRARLARLAPHAIFVNIGRGAVVDEAALADGLARRRIGGAVIDVTLEEPLPCEHPLWACPNTLLTQHTGGGYADELLDKARAFVRNLDRYERGEPLHDMIDLARGY